MTASTPFTRQAIKATFPEYEVVEETHTTEGETYSVLTVKREGETLLTIHPDPTGSRIFSVVVESPDIRNGLGPALGTSFNKVYRGSSSHDCSAGREEYSGKVLCPAPSAGNVTYLFSGHWAGPDGEVPRRTC